MESPGDTGWRQNWRGCQLDKEECLSLEQILQSFSAPISEEHAWAVIHQALQCLSKLLDELARCDTINLMYAVTNTNHILINTDGRVHRNTFMSTTSSNNTKSNILSGTSSRERAVSENKTVAELGVVIFTALDYGLKDEEERQLSPALENVIDLMTSADEDDEDLSGGESGVTDDEGIEDDHDEGETTGGRTENKDKVGGGQEQQVAVGKSGTCDTLIALCRHHLALPSEADSHFRAVCRALVTEAVELTSFMEKVSSSNSQVETDSELGQLDIQDWARLWVQVIHELRSGVRLKKTEFTRTPIEYELTPYEILMDDIRSKRYKLNKVMVEGRLPPKVKRDAHDVILEFIRSRPPLKPAGDRQLAAMRKQSTPVELLMESIRSEQSRNSLRKTSGPAPRPLVLTSVESSRCRLGDWEVGASPQFGKKMIKPDPDLVSSLLNFSDDGDTDSGDDHDQEPDTKQPSSQCSQSSGDRRSSWRKQCALDTILHGPRLTQQRRHSVSVCQTPTSSGPPPLPSQPQQPQKKISVSTEPDDEVSLQSTSSLCSSQRSLASGLSSPDVDISSYQLNTPAMHANLHTEFIHSDHWISALQTLELSLDEVVHIRSVLSRAELDALPLDNNLKDDVERGKICFLCMKTKFGIFSRGTKCQMCSQLVCNKCFAKMRIPLDHFSSVPVFALSPQSPEPETTNSSLSSTIKDKMSSLTPLFTSTAGSAPSSPVNKRKTATMNSPSGGNIRPASAGPGHCHASLPVYTSQGPSLVTKMGDFRRAWTRSNSGSPSGADSNRRDSLLGTLLCVCTDCKEMVLQVIRAQKTARRLQMTQSLFLNLEPSYTKEEIH